MLTGIHFLLTYTCTFECDHCFLYCSPRAGGTFTAAQIRDVLDQARKLGTVESIYYEGGEPFLYYPVLVEGLRLAREAITQPGGMCVLNAANEIAVAAFLAGEIGFNSIASLNERVLGDVEAWEPNSLTDVEALDDLARRCAEEHKPRFFRERRES